MPGVLMIRVPLRDEIPNVNYIKNQKNNLPGTGTQNTGTGTKQRYSAILHLKSMELLPDLHPGGENQK